MTCHLAALAENKAVPAKYSVVQAAWIAVKLSSNIQYIFFENFDPMNIFF